MHKKLIGIAIVAFVAWSGAAQEPQINPAEMQKMWESSGHSKALASIINNEKATADCYSCHSAEGFAAKLEGKKFDIADKSNIHTLTCNACHDMRNSSSPYKLIMDSERLCVSCHSQGDVLKGKGAKGIEETRSFHSAVPCASCHMSGRNHRMKVIRPDSPDLAENQKDTCTNCHRDNNRAARAVQLQDWQASYKKETDALALDLAEITSVLKIKPSALTPLMKRKLDDTQANLLILAKDRSRGAHNIDYTAEILNLAAKDIRKIKATLKGEKRAVR
jgi:predicted CXXCH cytochrome family protein